MYPRGIWIGHLKSTYFCLVFVESVKRLAITIHPHSLRLSLLRGQICHLQLPLIVFIPVLHPSLWCPSITLKRTSIRWYPNALKYPSAIIKSSFSILQLLVIFVSHQMKAEKSQRMLEKRWARRSEKSR